MSKKPVVVPLTSEEAATLAEHELMISQGLDAFLEVGRALIEIRDQKLYRIEYKTFEEYCNKRWNMSRRRGYQLMEAAKVAEDLCTNGSQIIENERQARALAAVPPHLRKEVIERAKAESAELTEQAVTRIVCRLLDERRAAAAEQRSAPKAEEEDEEEPREDESEESEEEAEPEEDEEEDASEPTTASTLRRAAKKAEKERLYLPRGLDHLRLAVKDLRKVDEGDLDTKDARQALREGLDAADEAFSRVRLMAAAVEDA